MKWYSHRYNAVFCESVIRRFRMEEKDESDIITGR